MKLDSIYVMFVTYKNKSIIKSEHKMKNLEKLVLPILVVLILSVLYFLYFAPSDELGSFSSFDTNSNASMPIIVKFVKDKGVQRQADGSYSFYVVDKENKEMLITGIKDLPPGMNDSKSMVLTGHMSGADAFHAHGIELRN
jgi:cytochrome c-type biogenesis protein CcmE